MSCQSKARVREVGRKQKEQGEGGRSEGKEKHATWGRSVPEVGTWRVCHGKRIRG